MAICNGSKCVRARHQAVCQQGRWVSKEGGFIDKILIFFFILSYIVNDDGIYNGHKVMNFLIW